MKRITSAENVHYKRLQKLAHSSRERRKAGLSLLDGINLISCYREHVGQPVQTAVSESGLENAGIQSLLADLVPLEPLLLSDALFRKLSTVETPTGVLAAVATPRPRPIMTSAVTSCVLLEGIQDPGNLGSILRSVAASGIEHVFLSRDAVYAWSPRVLRAGMGAHFMLQIHEQCDLPDFARDFNGRVIATSQLAIKSVFEVDLRGPVGLAFGNEGNGISPALLALAGEQVAIPMPGRVESLNVAAAAAICLYERVRQLSASTGLQPPGAGRGRPAGPG